MRKSVLVAGLVYLCAGVALGQGKMTNQWTCAKADTANSIPVGDESNHTYMIEQFKCTASKGEIAGVKDKEGTGTEFADVRGNHSRGHGVFVETMASGDTIYFSYQAHNVTKGGVATASNRWQATGGTGKFKGIKGSGGCSFKGNADGSFTGGCTGTYSLGK